MSDHPRPWRVEEPWDVEAEAKRWRVLAQALDGLCACYRTGTRPSERLLTTIKVTRAALKAAGEESTLDQFAMLQAGTHPRQRQPPPDPEVIAALEAARYYFSGCDCGSCEHCAQRRRLGNALAKLQVRHRTDGEE